MQQQGYSFFEAGKNVAILFKGRGWKMMVNDDLGDNILLILNLAVATSTGLIGWLFTGYDYETYRMVRLMYGYPSTASFM